MTPASASGAVLTSPLPLQPATADTIHSTIPRCAINRPSLALIAEQ
ncbi:MAG: hypothetical protein IPG17_23865 [Sandaracinaceae bacterium]|nr:hypothetical protein [Sandaracinaceae bacterium]MBK6812191.1 hypothetical protein [Sandaracinaceae bacterium]MBK7155955.1 hypothetical protein [Sandaracinaceae bacterium]MBK8410116.1 hypothetical protein [Sandaracinaceae bacterium]MBP7682286.1 hypothetical protein [Deltaproteobacteria bacterium]